MFSGLSPTYKGILLALGGYSSFAVADICAKWLAGSYSIPQVIGIENIIAAMLLVVLSPKLGGMKDLTNRKNLKINLFRAAVNAVTLVVLTYCYREFPIADVYAILFTKPFIVTLIALFVFNETCSGRRWLAIVAGFAGVLIAMQPGSEGFDPRMLWAVLGAVSISVLFISTRALKDPSPFSVAFFPVVGVLLLAVPLMIADFKMPTATDLPIYLLLGVMQVCGMAMVSWAYKITAAAVVAPMLYVEMIWALLFGWLIFGDMPDSVMLLGAGIIIASGIYLLFSERRNLPQ